MIPNAGNEKSINIMGYAHTFGDTIPPLDHFEFFPKLYCLLAQYIWQKI